MATTTVPPPGTPSADSAGARPERGPGRSGRNLPVAIAVGAALGAVVLVPLFTVKAVFAGVVAVTVCYAVHEMAVVLHRTRGRRIPTVVLAAGVVGTYTAAYERGSRALALGVLLTALAVLVALAARTLTGARTAAARRDAADEVSGNTFADIAADFAASIWVLGYVVLLAGFAVVLTGQHDGDWRTTAFITTVACSDIGGFATGVLAGKHPMAPSVSPKKTWEGFAGSVAVCMLSGALLFTLGLHQPVWQGLVFGLACVVSGTVGDLGESLIKRDLGVKDMGQLLPGHGGIMDRLDSLLAAAPVAYLLLAAFKH